MNKIEKALSACETVIEGIENGTISVESSLLQCLKIARLTNDTDGMIWLQYEYGGYPRDESGKIERPAFTIAYNNGRGSIDKEKQYIFTELASELEEKINAQKSAVNNFSTKGASVSGEQAMYAMGSLTHSVSESTNALLNSISLHQKRLSILKAKYYDYALQKSIELTFGNVASDVFTSYREKVDNYFSDLSNDTILKLQAIEDKINSNNPEAYSQALTTCRRLFENTATELFNKYFPSYSEKTYKTKSGKDIDVSGDHYINKLSAVIETLQSKSASKSVEGSNIIYTIQWIESLNKLQCKGVHSDITKHDAMQCIIHTYISLGDILSLQENYHD